MLDIYIYISDRINCILLIVRKINILRIVGGGFGCVGVFLPVCVQNRSFLRVGRAFVLPGCCFVGFLLCFVVFWGFCGLWVLWGGLSRGGFVPFVVGVGY